MMAGLATAVDQDREAGLRGFDPADLADGDLVEHERGTDLRQAASVNLANLVCVPGMDEETTDLLAFVGVDTLEKLRSETPDDLHSRVDAEKYEFKVKAPSLSDVKGWIAQARKLPDIVTAVGPREV